MNKIKNKQKEAGDEPIFRTTVVRQKEKWTLKFFMINNLGRKKNKVDKKVLGKNATCERV